MSAWHEKMAKNFQAFPGTKHMTYTEHVWDGLVLSFNLSCYGCGIFIHTLFPMVLQKQEQYLISYLRLRDINKPCPPPTVPKDDEMASL